MTEDVRWVQRFQIYLKAFDELKEWVQLGGTRELSKLERQGIIHGFEYVHELAWNTLKDYLASKGFVGLVGSKDNTREAFKNGLVTSGEVWMEMIQSRNLTSHTYNHAVAETVYRAIMDLYYPAFVEFADRFSQLVEAEGDG